MSSDGQQLESRSPRSFALIGSLRSGIQRFPVVAGLSVVAFVLGMLYTFDVFGAAPGIGLFGYPLGLFNDEGVSLLERLVSYLYAACPFGGIAAVVARLRAERAGAGDDRALRDQMLAGIAALVVSVALAAAGEWLDRGALVILIRLGLMLAGVFWSVWLLMTSDNERTLFPQLLCAGLYVGLIVSVLFAGLCICILAAQVLVFDEQGQLDRLYEVASLACFVLLAPNLLCGRLPRHDEELHTSRAYQVLAGYVTLPLCLILLGVLYVYIAKIAVVCAMPSGEMNWFGSFALLVYIGLWLGLRDMEWVPAQRFVRWGWAMLVPVVVTQIIGVVIRFQAYGLTTARYAGMLCLAVGITALALGALDRSPRNLLAVATAVALMGAVSPANILDIPNLEQTSRLTNALADAGMLDAEGKATPATNGEKVSADVKEQIDSSWDYLHYVDEGYFSSTLVDDLRERAVDQDFEELFGFKRPIDEDEARYSDWYRITFQAEGSSTAISGFSSAYDLDNVSEGSCYDLEPQDEYKLSLVWDDGAKLETSLKDLVEALPAGMTNESTIVEVPAEDLRVNVGDGRVLALSSASLEVENGEPSLLAVEGLLLVP